MQRLCLFLRFTKAGVPLETAPVAAGKRIDRLTIPQRRACRICYIPDRARSRAENNSSRNCLGCPGYLPTPRWHMKESVRATRDENAKAPMTDQTHTAISNWSGNVIHAITRYRTSMTANESHAQAVRTVPKKSASRLRNLSLLNLSSSNLATSSSISSESALSKGIRSLMQISRRNLRPFRFSSHRANAARGE